MPMISRDPFARSEVHRRVATEITGATCRWCGNKRPRSQHLFKYSTETDGGRVFEHEGLFCSKPCHDAYHGD